MTLTLIDAINSNDPHAVAQCLDKPDTQVSTEDLVALVHLAWKNRGSEEDPERVESAERARQVFDLIAATGADLQTPTARGSVIDRILKAQPDWPQAVDLGPRYGQPQMQTGRTPEELESDIASARPARGAMHRYRPN